MDNAKKAQFAAKRRNENLGRRIEILLIKAHELWDKFDVDVAVILKNTGTVPTIDKSRCSQQWLKL
jgi:hypothetical protein